VLRNAHETMGNQFDTREHYPAAIAHMRAWDGQLRRDSKAALLYVYWREQLEEDYGQETMTPIAAEIDQLQTALGAPLRPVELSEEQLNAALESFSQAARSVVQHFGSLDATYGDRFRVGRDDKSWPLGGGGNSRLGLSTLRNVGYGDQRPDHTQWGQSGQTSTQIVVLTKPIKSWTYVPIGQSDRSDSPHYTDQAEKLFSPRQMKETWWLPEQLAGNIVSRTELENAG
jgi:acyl-homoserine lactone acylase PvdQ